MPSSTNLTRLAAALLVWSAGCPQGPYEDSLSVTLVQINRIVEDEDLSARQKRTQLEELDIEPGIINALLADDRTANQFGGDILSVFDKLSGGRFTELTPDEVQILGDEAGEVRLMLSYTLTDEEAQAIVSFFRDNNLNTATDLDVYLSDAANAVPSGIPDGVLRDLFIDFDPETLPREIADKPAGDEETGVEG